MNSDDLKVALTHFGARLPNSNPFEYILVLGSPNQKYGADVHDVCAEALKYIEKLESDTINSDHVSAIVEALRLRIQCMNGALNSNSTAEWFKNEVRTERVKYIGALKVLNPSLAKFMDSAIRY
jgi:hypothetical protein